MHRDRVSEIYIKNKILFADAVFQHSGAAEVIDGSYKEVIIRKISVEVDECCNNM